MGELTSVPENDQARSGQQCQTISYCVRKYLFYTACFMSPVHTYVHTALHYPLIMVLCVHGTVCTWCCVYMVLCVHGAVCTWCCVYMVLCVHGTVCTWYCVYMVLCVHGAVCTWYCVYMVLCVHGTVCTWCMHHFLPGIMGECGWRRF